MVGLRSRVQGKTRKEAMVQGEDEHTVASDGGLREEGSGRVPMPAQSFFQMCCFYFDADFCSLTSFLNGAGAKCFLFLHILFCHAIW